MANNNTNTKNVPIMTNIDPESNVDITDTLSKEMLIGCLPDKRYRPYVTDEVINLVNSEPDSEMRRVYRDNTLNYTSVLVQGRFSLAAYINAIKFVSLKLLGNRSSDAYKKVFPDRYVNLLTKGITASQIASFADNYAKNALVVKIMEQTIVPTHILNAHIYQEAINVQADLMKNAHSDMVKMKAAACLIENLRAPEVAKISLDIGYTNDVIDDLRATTRALAQQQKALIENGQLNAKDIAESDIIKKTTYTVIDAELEEANKKDSEDKEHVSLFDNL